LRDWSEEEGGEVERDSESDLSESEDAIGSSPGTWKECRRIDSPESVRLGNGMPSLLASILESVGDSMFKDSGVFTGGVGIGRLSTCRRWMLFRGEPASVLSDGKSAGFLSPAFLVRCAVSRSSGGNFRRASLVSVELAESSLTSDTSFSDASDFTVFREVEVDSSTS